MLPEVRQLVGSIVQLTALLPELQEQVRTAEYMRGRPGSGEEARQGLDEAVSRLRDAELELSKAALGLEGLGVVLKDPQTGLIDFPSLMEGEIVELCWRLGEEKVAHWHRVGEGFRGRKPL
jgi:hypothetical protein